MRRIYTTDRRQVELRNGPQLSERRRPSWLTLLVANNLPPRYNKRKGERRTGFDRRARVQPAHPALPYKPLWAHN